MDLSNFWQFAIVLIGVSTAWTAWSQHLINKENLKLNLFEKRFLVFKATRKFLSVVFKNAEISLEDLYEYRANTSEKDFFFENDIINYLEEIDSKAFELWKLGIEIRDLPKGSNELSEKVKKESQCLESLLIDKLPKLKTVFSPYMKFKP